MIETLKQRDFARLWLAGLISITGDWILIIGLPLYVFRLTGSSLATGGLLMVGTLPGLLLGTVAGVFVDRWDRRRLMIVVNLLLALALVPLLFVESAETIWIIYVVRLITATLSQFFRPAENALLPTLVGDDHLVAANSLNGLNNNLARLAGPAIGGLVIGLGGLAGVALLDMLSFIVAALLIAGIASNRPPARTEVRRSVSFAAIAGEWREGLAFARRRPILSRVLLISTIAMIGEGFFGTLIAPFVVDTLHGSDADFGYLLAAQAFGGIAGSVFIGRLAKRLSPYRLIAFGAIGLGIMDALLFCTPLLNSGIVPGSLCIAIAGIPAVAYVTGMMTLLQILTADSFRGRIFGLSGALAALTTLVSAGLAGVLGDNFSTMGLLLVLDAGGYVLVGILALALLNRRQTSPNVEVKPA